MRRTIIVLSIVLLGSVLGPARADRGGKSDGDDVSGPLDIVRIVHRHRNHHPNAFIHEISMQAPWNSSILHSGPRTARYITVSFDVRPEDGYGCTGCITEREVIIDFGNEGLKATLYNHLGDPPRRLARLKVWRPNDRTVAFSVRKRQLRRGEYGYYDWGVQTVYEEQDDADCPRDHACIDLAPNGRYNQLRHEL